MGDIPAVVKPATQPPRSSRAEHVLSDTKPATSDIVATPSDAHCPSPYKIVISSCNRIDMRKWMETLPVFVGLNSEAFLKLSTLFFLFISASFRALASFTHYLYSSSSGAESLTFPFRFVGEEETVVEVMVLGVRVWKKRG
ncbi:hypothetical protein RYX36_009214 [Vicia faba]